MAEMSRFSLLGAAATALALLAAPAAAAPEVGKPAPEFAAVDASGAQRSLAEFRGKTVVLEWTNHECPYVRKHYESGAMQSLQKEATGAGVTWLSIISSPPGAQGHVSPAEAVKLTEKRQAAPSAVLMDPEGKIGRSYDAKVTPHMYVIDPQGVLRYAGAIDDKPTSSPSSLNGANNYVKAALADLDAGREVATKTSRAYGCTIKYSSPGA